MLPKRYLAANPAVRLSLSSALVVVLGAALLLLAQPARAAAATPDHPAVAVFKKYADCMLAVQGDGGRLRDPDKVGKCRDTMWSQMTARRQNWWRTGFSGFYYQIYEPIERYQVGRPTVRGKVVLVPVRYLSGWDKKTRKWRSGRAAVIGSAGKWLVEDDGFVKSIAQVSSVKAAKVPKKR